ncbi:MAG: MBL fold metallo-hydrolase [Gammaproteobacteria bacterium]|jgi:L-ascorbate metabolism protein UlaG (beta-lactamase superfamily)
MEIRTSRTLVLAMAILAGTACATQTTNSARPHHTGNGFTNPQERNSTGLLDFLKWRWQRLFRDIPAHGTYDFPRAQPDIDFLRDNRSITTATWIGHATLLVQMDGFNILTDPHFSERASPVQWAGPRRVVAPGIRLEELPAIDYVVISHDHYDALDADSIRGLFERPGGEQTTFVVPLQLGGWLRERGITRVVELDWWESHQQAGIRLTAVPSQHWSKRTPFSTNTTLWAGWAIRSPSFSFYFCGDTGYYQPMFREIGDRLGPFDLAAIPIGAYAPRWFMQGKHLDPEEAVRVHQDVRARKSIGIHWGTFILSDEPLDEPPQRLRQALRDSGMAAEEFLVLRPGETARF